MLAQSQGHSPHDAQDLTQGFFLHLLEHQALTGVDRLKGKFRSFLLASFQNHLSDVIDRAYRLKRGGDKEIVHLDAEAAEERYRLEPVELLTAENNSSVAKALHRAVARGGRAHGVRSGRN